MSATRRVVEITDFVKTSSWSGPKLNPGDLNPIGRSPAASMTSRWVVTMSARISSRVSRAKPGRCQVE